MRYRTFLVTGVEVLELGGQHWESNPWPAEHWKENSGRFRLFTVAIDEQVSAALEGRSYGGTVEGVVVALEVADFAGWPEATFVKKNTTPSFKPKHRDLWCFAKLDWSHIQNLSLTQQYSAYAKAVLEALERYGQSKRKPKGFMAQEFIADLRSVLRGLKPSTLTRAAYAKSNA